MNKMNCKNLKQKLNRTLYCKHKKSDIKISECNNCKFKEFKTLSEYKYKSTEKALRIKNKTNKLAKLERKRYSIIFTDLTICCECGLKHGDYDIRLSSYTTIEKNEIYEGAYRQLSMKLGMVAPFCQYCHNRFHKDILFNLYYKSLFQKEYLKIHSREEFITIFKQDYVYKYTKLLTKKQSY